MSDLTEITILKELNADQKMAFMNEMSTARKNATAGVLLALFLGGFGGHHYYLGNIILGVIYTLFCWTFIPGIVAFVEMFLMPGRVRAYNEQKAYEIANKVKAIWPSTEAAGSSSAS